jgi:hypothetical protein
MGLKCVRNFLAYFYQGLISNVGTVQYQAGVAMNWNGVVFAAQISKGAGDPFLTSISGGSREDVGKRFSAIKKPSP